MNPNHDALGRFGSGGSGKVSARGGSGGSSTDASGANGKRVGEIIEVDGEELECVEYHDDVQRGKWVATKPMNPGSAFPLRSEYVFSDKQIADAKVIKKAPEKPTGKSSSSESGSGSTTKAPVSMKTVFYPGEPGFEAAQDASLKAALEKAKTQQAARNYEREFNRAMAGVIRGRRRR
jgi:hypothetical protein